MKKIILSAIALVSAAGVFAQGTVIFDNRYGGTTHVYAPLGPGDTTRIVGQASNDSQPAGVNYGGRLVIGASGTGGQYGAATTLAQLLGAPGSNQPESSLLPSSGAPHTFRTGTAAGGVSGYADTFSNIPQDAPVATFEMVAWDNFSGLYPTWALASVAWNAGLIAAGKSPLFTLNNIGGQNNLSPTLFNSVLGAPGPGGVQSFNLYFIPEPMTATLGGLGVLAFIISRRRK
jgi:hypothetical protein